MDGKTAVAVAMAEAANEVKASEIQVLCVKPLIYWARFFVLVTAFSKPQIDAVGYVALVLSWQKGRVPTKLMML